MRKFLLYIKTRPLALVSFIVLAALYLMMLFAEFVAPYAPTTSFADQTFHPPNVRWYHGAFQAQEWRVTNTVSWRYARVRDLYSPIRLFAKGEPYKLWGLIPMNRHLFTTDSGAYPVLLMGADHLGRDLFSRIIYGSRISLTIGFIATALSLFLAMVFGGLSGYFGGLTDWGIMRFSEFFMLIPGLYLILFLRSLLSTNMDSGQAYMMITLILSLVGWPGSARTIRGMVHTIKREEFVMNAQLEMMPSLVIILRHIIPQIASLLIVSVALSVPGFIMTETTLSYLGLGIVDPAVSWGSLIRRDISTLTNLVNYPWILSPMWFLLIVTFGFNFVGDALRDFYDPYHTVFPRLLKKQRKTRTLVTETSAVAAASAVSAAPRFLEVRDLTVNFSVLRGRTSIYVQAVRGVSFSLTKGEVLGIVGESGSGKSVSTQAIPALLPKNALVSGTILYEGQELLGLSTEALRAYRGKKIGMIFQEPGRSYDPLQNMKSVFFETLRNSDPAITREAAMEKAVALLAETGLENGQERLSNFPHQFSGGQLQRIGIALALAQSCELLIADEPTTALDVTIQKQIIDLLKDLRRTRQISIIFISHNIDLVADISDRIMVMYGGLEMEAATAATITQAPLHPYTRALLAASPRFGSHYSRERLQSIPGKVSDPAMPEPGCPFAPRCPDATIECTNGIPSLRTLARGRELRCVSKSTLSEPRELDE
ncbi:MAG: dipeptide/oligopeptide/nickel ABC transporter permease/ATP-binding protein [Treponema sp.]|jgi:peptide/nickel transport system permease protein|nr:dipeptide/oligopeptide/nickel ABC transporter permease/ATP-binding protein [Treponema sp.]